MQTLPKLLRSAEERQRLLDLLDRLAGNVELNPEQRAFLPEFRRVLSRHVGASCRRRTAHPRSFGVRPQQSRPGVKPAKEGYP